MPMPTTVTVIPLTVTVITVTVIPDTDTVISARGLLSPKLTTVTDTAVDTDTVDTDMVDTVVTDTATADTMVNLLKTPIKSLEFQKKIWPNFFAKFPSFYSM